MRLTRHSRESLTDSYVTKPIPGIALGGDQFVSDDFGKQLVKNQSSPLPPQKTRLCAALRAESGSTIRFSKAYSTPFNPRTMAPPVMV
jgi:hypothetical protein